MSSTVLLMEEYQFFGFLTLICATVGGVIAVRELTEKDSVKQIKNRLLIGKGLYTIYM